MKVCIRGVQFLYIPDKAGGVQSSYLFTLQVNQEWGPSACLMMLSCENQLWSNTPGPDQSANHPWALSAHV